MDNTITWTTAGDNSYVSLAVDASNLNHNLLSQYEADEHTNHNACGVTAGDGLAGGGDMTTTRSLEVNMLGLEDLADPGVDRLAYYKQSAGAWTWFSLDGADLEMANPDTLVVLDSGINHDATTNFLAAEHIDHSAVSITAGSGLTGGGTIDQTRSLAVNWAAAAALDASGALSVDHLTEAELDTEAELEAQLTDVANVFTDNDGALNDDDVTAADVGAASPNLDPTDASVEWEDAAALDASGALSVDHLTEAELDTEAELEAQLTDVANVFTDNDGALNDDDVTAADVGAASPNLDPTDASVEWEDAAQLDASGALTLTGQAAGDVAYFNGANWVRLAKGSPGEVLEMNGAGTAPEWDTDDTGGGASVTYQTKSVSFTASANYHYLCDLATASGDLTVTLPASPTEGDTITVTVSTDDLANNDDVLWNLNGNNLQGSADDDPWWLRVKGDTVTLTHSGDATYDWHVAAHTITPHAVKLKNTAAQTLNLGFNTNVFKTEEFDSAGTGDYTTNERVDIARDGIYQIDAMTSENGAVSVAIVLQIDGADIEVSGNYIADRSVCSTSLQLNAGQYVKMRTYASAGGVTTNTAHDPYLSVIELRP